MRMWRAIGYQETNVKHRTARTKKPCAERLRLTLRPKRPAVSCLAGRGAGFDLRSVATSAIESPVTCGLPAGNDLRAWPGLGAGQQAGPHAFLVAGFTTRCWPGS